jgi:hypothetical protein
MTNIIPRSEDNSDKFGNEGESYRNPNNWGISPIRDAVLRRQMAQNPDWDMEQLNTPIDPEIEAIVNRHNSFSGVLSEYENSDSEAINFSEIVPVYAQDATWSLYGYGESNPYDEIETIDDTEYPLAHGQLLPHLSGKLPPDLIYQLGQGDFEALQYIDDSETLNWAWNRMQQLGEAGAWGDDWGTEGAENNEFISSDMEGLNGYSESITDDEIDEDDSIIF